VLAAMGFGPEWALGGLRLTVGRHSTEQDVDALLNTLPALVEKLREQNAEQTGDSNN
jgi:cysteine desulfurase